MPRSACIFATMFTFVSSFPAADRLPDITHIVFVVHGVGQVIDDTTIIRNTNQGRRRMNNKMRPN
jgi:hypothetical protein